MANKKCKSAFQLPLDNEISEPKPDIFKDRISISELKKIWNDRNVIYTDDELYQIREWLYVIAGAVIKVVENTSGEVLQEVSKRKRKKPLDKCLVFFDAATKNAA